MAEHVGSPSTPENLGAEWDAQESRDLRGNNVIEGDGSREGINGSIEVPVLSGAEFREQAKYILGF